MRNKGEVEEDTEEGRNRRAVRQVESLESFFATSLSKPRSVLLKSQ